MSYDLPHGNGLTVSSTISKYFAKIRYSLSSEAQKGNRQTKRHVELRFWAHLVYEVVHNQWYNTPCLFPLERTYPIQRKSSDNLEPTNKIENFEKLLPEGLWNVWKALVTIMSYSWKSCARKNQILRGQVYISQYSRKVSKQGMAYCYGVPHLLRIPNSPIRLHRNTDVEAKLSKLSWCLS